MVNSYSGVLNKSINTKNCELFHSSDLEEYTSHVIEPMISSHRQRNFRSTITGELSYILNLTVNVNKYNPLHAGCHIELLREIKIKRAVINVQFLGNASCGQW